MTMKHQKIQSETHGKHRRLWLRLGRADYGRKLSAHRMKLEAMGAGGDGVAEHQSCWACDACREYCDKCVLEWPAGKGCWNTKGLFRGWVRAVESGRNAAARRLAREIAYLPWDASKET